MNAYIGSLEFMTMTGDIYPAGPVVEPIQRPGVNGTMWRYLGSKGRAFKVKTMAFYSDASTVNAFLVNYSQSVGLDLILTDPTGMTWGVYVEESMPSLPKYVLNSTLGAGYLVECEWTLRVTGG
jgi:hypothetical protein